MPENFPSVAFLPAGIDACALYRMFIPHLNMPRSKFIFRPGKMRPEEFEECSVALVQRLVTKENLVAINYMRNMGMKVIYDLDDNMWSVPAANPGYALIREHQQGFGVCAQASDLITVSTKGLASVMTSALPGIKQPILIVPNSIDFRLFRPSQVRHTDGNVVIGWAGSNTHDEDLREAWGVLPGILQKYSNVRMEFVGGTNGKAPKGMDTGPRVKVRGWVPVGEFPARFASWAWDIAMAPLSDNRFNRSKSNIKMLEAAALKIPCLASRVRPYEEFAALGGEKMQWLLCEKESQWREKLERLVEDKEDRKSVV